MQKLILREIQAYKGIDGWLTPKEASALSLLAALIPQGSTIVEIGSWKGKSTYCLAKGAGTRGRIYAIDPFDYSGEPGSAEDYQQRRTNMPLIDEFRENMRARGVMESIQPLQGLSQDFVGCVPKIDLLFIDGDHSKEACDSDFLNYAPFVCPGGYVLLHDFDATRKDLGPTWVVENRLLPSKEYEFIGCFDSLWVARKLGQR